ncbi:MAG: PilZ domain-containing protein [Candidatus Solibacter usitatus]|nr:PilZ domain-containing protein [Candidatus Solibacter usitatus]
MERRQSPRLEAGFLATLTTLVEPGETMPVRVEDVSGAGMRLTLAARIQPGTPVKISLQDRLLLGEVAWCDWVNGGIQAGVVLEHSLDGLNHLRALVDALTAEAASVLHPGAHKR